MRRMLLVLSVTALMAAMMALNAGYAFAQPQEHNPNILTTPAATPFTGPGGGCVFTYNAPPAEGAPPPGSSAAGGAPGYVQIGVHGNCL
jgi:hypothetical protein